MTEPEICPVSEVRVNIPRRKLQRLFEEHWVLEDKESSEMRRFLVKLEKNIHILQHTQSIVYKILQRAK